MLVLANYYIHGMVLERIKIMNNTIKTTDSTITKLIQKEHKRQEENINLIASENYADPAVLAVQSSVLTNKYAEGYPTKRYYAGCQFIDEIEQHAIDLAKELFNTEHANVQPHSGSQANMALYNALLKPGDTILAMNLSAGGHLTHGHHVNFSGTFYNIVHYGVNRTTELIDYDEVTALAEQHKPVLIVAGASAYSRIIDFKKFKEIADAVGAFFAADIAHIAGLIAADLHPSPVSHADVISSTTHKTLRGPRGGLLLSNASLKEKIDRAVFPGSQGGPLMNTIAAKAVAFRLALSQDFADYQRRIIQNAKSMATAFKNRGYRIVSDGTDNHLFIVDLQSKGCTGRDAENLLDQVGITVSRSCIPFDPQRPWITSGIRVGTPAITTRGFTGSECEQIVELVDTTLSHADNQKKLDTIGVKVRELALARPIYDNQTLIPDTKTPLITLNQP